MGDRGLESQEELDQLLDENAWLKKRVETLAAYRTGHATRIRLLERQLSKALEARDKIRQSQQCSDSLAALKLTQEARHLLEHLEDF